MKRQPRAVTNPPMTAVTLVDFRLHSATVTGEISSATAVDKAPSQPGEEKKRRVRINLIKSTFIMTSLFVSLSTVIFTLSKCGGVRRRCTETAL